MKGKISKIVYEYSTFAGTGTFWISDDGTGEGDKNKEFECYSLYWFNNQQWKEGDGQIAVGDEVVVVGQLTIYSGTYETSSKKAWLYSLNGKTE